MNPMNQQQPQDEEEDSDYDIFASVRPKGISVDDNPEDEASGEDIDVDDFADFRPKEEEINKVKREKNKPKKQYTALETAKDVAKQGAKGVLIGAGGAWGDLAELAGINRENPTDTAKNARDFDTLDKINEPGKKRGFWETFAQVNDLSDDSPTQLRLPTSKNLETLNDAVGGPGEAETMAGRYANRTGKIYGAGLAFGQVDPSAALLAGAAGQTAEEAGAGPLAQAAAEIAALILSPGQAGQKLAGKAKQEVERLVNKMRAIGYSEKDITLAINSASKGKSFGVKASKSAKTEQAFEDFAERSDDIVKNILESEVTGYEKGAKYVHDLASDAYGQVVEEASKINIKNLDPFFDSMNATMKDIKKNIGHSAEAKSFMTELTDHTLDIISNPTAENMIDFYRRLNGLGKWVKRDRKDRIIKEVKDSIKDTFRSEGKQGRELADKFEKVNEGIQKAYKAEDVSKIMDSARTQEGIDYKKLSKSFDKPGNVKLFEEVLGTKQANNIKMISKIGKEVKDFDKAYKATNLLLGTTTSKAAHVGYLIYSGSWPAIAAMKGMEVIGRKLAEKSLTDPKFQNFMIKGLHAIKNESGKTFSSVNNALQKYLEEEGIKVNLGPKD